MSNDKSEANKELLPGPEKFLLSVPLYEQFKLLAE